EAQPPAFAVDWTGSMGSVAVQDRTVFVAEDGMVGPMAGNVNGIPGGVLCAVWWIPEAELLARVAGDAGLPIPVQFHGRHATQRHLDRTCRRQPSSDGASRSSACSDRPGLRRRARQRPR